MSRVWLGIIAMVLLGAGCTRQWPQEVAVETPAQADAVAEDAPHGAQAYLRAVQSAESRDRFRREWDTRNDVDAEILLLHSEDALVRARAAARLHDLIHDKPDEVQRAIPDLIVLLGDESELPKYSSVHPMRATFQPTTPGREAALALRWIARGRVPAPVAPALIEALDTATSAYELSNIVWVLAATGSDKAAPIIIPLLDSEDSTCRAAAIDALGELKDDRAIEPLLALLAKTDGSRVQVLKALHNYAVEHDSVLDALCVAAETGDDEERAAAVTVLGDYHLRTYERAHESPRSARMVRVVMNALATDPSPEVRAAAAKMNLGKFETDAIVDALIRSFHEDPAAKVRGAALWRLRYAKKRESEVVELLPLACVDEDPYVRMSALGICGQRVGSHPELVEAIILRLDDEDSEVRRCTAGALGKAKSREAVRVLLNTIEHDEDARLRQSAIYALLECIDYGRRETPHEDDGRIRRVLDELAMDADEPDYLRCVAANVLVQLVGGSDANDIAPLSWWSEHREEYMQ